jgi:D-alanine-D-alanine ligase-like ATP-grasp enzyme
MATSYPHVAVLYQAQEPPVIDGIRKPMKPGGYSDSGADIAYVLRQAGVPIATPVANPDPTHDLDWVFPDTAEGIAQAQANGAQVLWLNTILFRGHPIEAYLAQGGHVVGQPPKLVERYDDKWTTNELLRKEGLPIPLAHILERPEVLPVSFSFPVVLKPIRGRGSAGVELIPDATHLASRLQEVLATGDFGNAVLVEQFLAGQEITITIMPPGHYLLDGKEQVQPQHWSLPPVRRFNHQAGIAPYNGTVAITENSAVLEAAELASPNVRQVMQQCATAAQLVGAKAPIRIDCRQQAAEGKYYLFDLNMKPNMTGAARPGRENQDSLSALAARAIGWSYPDLLLAMLRQAWSPT